jgi:hypothetical protein
MVRTSWPAKKDLEHGGLEPDGDDVAGEVPAS